jgi:hypothetical protein
MWIVAATPALRGRVAEQMLDLHVMVTGVTSAFRAAIELWSAGEASGDLSPLVARAFEQLRAALGEPLNRFPSASA